MKFSLNPDTVSAVNINRQVPAPVDKVYKAWTQGSTLTKWWLADGTSWSMIDTEPKVEGAFTVRYRLPSGKEVQQEGAWIEVSKNHMLVLNLGPDSLHKNEGGTLITVEFRKGDKGCALMVTHEGLPDANSQERCRQDWLKRLERLDKVVA